MVAVLGFVALAGLIVALGTSSTARYEFERNRVHDRPQQPATGTDAGVGDAGGGAAGRPSGFDPAAPGSSGRGASRKRRAQQGAVGVAAHPAGKRGGERASVSAWWLVDESGDGSGGQVVAGPFSDQIEAEWAALAGGLAASVRAVYGAHRAGEALVGRQSPQERAWLAELGHQLDRLAEDWDELLSDTDALTTLVVEVAAALVESGLGLHDCAGRGPAADAPGGGVCLTPDPGLRGILVSWRQHDRMSLQQVRGAVANAAVQQTMNAAVADVLVQVGFRVEAFGSTGCHLVTAGLR
jgi:hypothetical protein